MITQDFGVPETRIIISDYRDVICRRGLSPEARLEEIISQLKGVPSDDYLSNFRWLDSEFNEWFKHNREVVCARRQEESRKKLATSNFTLFELVGKGCWGDVYRGIDHATGEEKAIKLLNPTELAREQMKERKLNPFEVMKNEAGQAECAYVVPREFRVDENGTPFIIMPYYQRFFNEVLRDENNPKFRNYVGSPGNLIDYYTARGYILDIAKGLAEMHRIRKRVHGDLKPDNIALKELDDRTERALLSDLGTSTCASFGWTLSPRDNMGFTQTRAPENFKKLSHPTKQSDCYALAALTYRIFTGEYPLENESVDLENENVFNRTIKKKLRKARIPRKIKKVIRDNLSFYPWERDSDGQKMYERLEDALKNTEFNKVLKKIAAVGLGLAVAVTGVSYLNYRASLHEPLHLGMPEQELRGVSYELVDGGKPIEFESEKLEDLPGIKTGLTDERSDREAKRWTQNRNVAYLVKTHYQAWKHLNPPKECLWGYGETNENLISEYQWKVHLQRINENRDTMARRPEDEPQLCWTYAINQGLNYARDGDKVDLEDTMAIARVGIKPVDEARRISKSFDWKNYRSAKYSDGKFVIPEKEQTFVNTWLAYYHANVD